MVYHKNSRSKATVYHPYVHYPTKLYLLTISKHQKLSYVLSQDIVKVISYLKNTIQLKVTDHSFETSGMYSQLHSHSIVHVGSFFKYTDFKSILGFHLVWKQVNNLKGALNYIYKDTQNNAILQSQIIADNFYMHKLAPNLFL